MRKIVWILLCLPLLLAAWLFWPSGRPPTLAAKNTAAPVVAAVTPAAPAAPLLPAVTGVIARSAASTNREFYRLSNTPKTVGQLSTATHAILLENALIDTAVGLDLKIPSHLRASGDPGAYIVQARGLVDGPFRALLAAAGAQIVSYIPNNAYLVQLTSSGAAALAGDAQVQAVLPFEPYYKIQASLLGLAVSQKPLPPGQVLTLGLYAAGADDTLAQIVQMGGAILALDRSPFGPVVRVRPPTDWIALAQLPGVERVEPATRRELANDLARVALGIATNTVVAATTDWLGLSGKNVMVEVNDTGIDPGHPDFTQSGTAGGGPSGPTRVFGDTATSLYDTAGHGTHVAGVIAGNGSMSRSPLNVGSVARGSVTNADFRGKAPSATLFSVGFLGANDTNLPYISDQYLQEMPALTNALISNNSWDNGASEYDLEAASYDAAVRDALPGVTGPQPVLFVFAAGNNGGGSDNGGNAYGDTILSPGTAKNVVTVGALEQYRLITNIVTALDGTTNAIWLGETSSSTDVAGYSSRGNVGIDTEGTFGRFKPDVVAPGTFVVSTQPSMWDKPAYYNPTNTDNSNSGYGLLVTSNTLAYGFATSVPGNAVGVNISVVPNSLSPNPFPTNMQIYLSTSQVPNPANSGTYDLATSNNVMAIPPGGGTLTGVGSLANGFTVTVADGTTIPVNFNLIISIILTNSLGNELTVLKSLNDTLGSYYYYESGTSIATPSVSGALALIQDFFVNQKNPSNATNPSPALLKAMLINGARLTTGYNFYGVTNTVNDEGWGEANVPNSVPRLNPSSTGGATTAMYFLDQSPTNALATGDSRTFSVSVPTAGARGQLLHITLAWTDPPGNPVAGIKLVNNLDLVVTNSANGQVFYGNNFSGASPISVPANAGTVADNVNNVESVVLPYPQATNYSVTVIGRNVAVNAVTTEQTNIVQDYALVISCGDGSNSNGIVVTPSAANVSSTVPLVTVINNATNGVYFNEVAGANAPWLSTNAIVFGPSYGYAPNSSLFIGQTNQWHFFVVTNTSPYTNAAFIIFDPATLAIPREGVFAGSDANSTRPEADLNLFVAGPADPNASSLTNLNSLVISNCVFGTNGDQASLDRGGTKFIVYSNAAYGQTYYVGVQCEDQMAGQFGFIPIFSLNPFGSTDPNGNQVIYGFPLPTVIPDGNNAHPVSVSIFALATTPMQVAGVTVTNGLFCQNSGDLVGTVSHGSTYAVLNNHTGPQYGFTNAYNDEGLPGTQHTDGPGSLTDFVRQPAVGPWVLTEIDDSMALDDTITAYSLVIRPHIDLNNTGVQNVTVPAGGWFYDYVTVTPGFTNITVSATNLPPDSSPPLQLYLGYQTEPTASNYLAEADLTNGTPPGPLGNSISYGPPLPPGTYYVGIFNPDPNNAHSVALEVNLAFSGSAGTTVDYDSAGPVALLDDAVTNSFITVTNTDLIEGFKVGLCVAHPRISDLVFHLISPDGTRYLIMENRGGQDTNGCGIAVTTTNVVGSTTNVSTAFGYLTFTEDTNFTTTPIKYAVPPFVPLTATNLGLQTNITFMTNGSVVSLSGFETPAAGDYVSGTNVDGWNVVRNQVSVVNDATNAQAGSQFLALANGSITRTLATVAGSTNTLTFTYRGPGIAGWWRAENNANDSIGGNNGTLNGGTYGAGEVGQAFQLNGINQYVTVLDSTSLRPSSVTLEGWVSFNSVGVNDFIAKPYGPATEDSYDVWYQNTGLYAGINLVSASPPALSYTWTPLFGTWHHIAYTFENGSGAEVLYLDGVAVASGTGSGPILYDNHPMYIGADSDVGVVQEFFPGSIDEASLYNRALSGSEIKSIFQNRSVGKYDPTVFNTSPAQSLAEAAVSIPGVTNIVLYGNNTNWQTQTITFVAPTNGTPLQITGLEPGMLLDSFTTPGLSAVTNVFTNAVGNVYYLPEQSLSPLIGTSAAGIWQLEILDNRAGATNPAPSLLSWQLEFNFANASQLASTNVLVGGIAQTNTVGTNSLGAGSILWYTVNVPTSAAYATNRLIFSTAPVNLWFSTNSPQTITNAGDVELLTNLTSGIGVPILSTNTTPLLVPGGTYYLGVQNTNSFVVTNAVEVDFDNGNATNSGLPSFVIKGVKVSGGTTQITWAVSGGAQYEVQWKNSLTNAWNTITDPATTVSNGIATFTDNGSQTAPRGPMRFYRLVRLP